MKLFITNKQKLLLAGLFILGVSCMVGVAGYIYQIYYSPIMSSAPDGNSVILIPRGSTFDSVTARIRKKGLLPYPRLYDYLAEKLKVHSRIQAGEFKIQHNWNTSELLQYLRKASGIALPFRKVKIIYKLQSACSLQKLQIKT